MIVNGAASGAHLRQYPRLTVNFPVTYAIDGSSIGKQGRFRNIGGGGIAFESNEPLAKNTTVAISFELQPGLRIAVSGRVVSSAPANAKDLHLHSLVFTEITDEVRDSILTYIFEAWRAVLLSKA